jgi:hypothetical protein
VREFIAGILSITCDISATGSDVNGKRPGIPEGGYGEALEKEAGD